MKKVNSSKIYILNIYLDSDILLVITAAFHSLLYSKLKWLQQNLNVQDAKEIYLDLIR